MEVPQLKPRTRRGYVRDRDKIDVGELPIRSNELAAPEATQARSVRICYLNSADIVEVMIRQGLKTTPETVANACSQVT
jgi:hypothetical protein